MIRLKFQSAWRYESPFQLSWRHGHLTGGKAAHEKLPDALQHLKLSVSPEKTHAALLRDVLGYTYGSYLSPNVNPDNPQIQHLRHQKGLKGLQKGDEYEPYV